ncbi:MAG TPA: MacB family efflux pump subunit [Patescibacteria group bacterium]|nr:MacB family efflux pump subunit [Patescibacteria group bacterium]
MATPLLELRDIRRHYESGDSVVKALDGVSLKIFPGEFVAVMGQSGSGKSTFMNIVGCLDSPTSGEYFIRGVDAAGLAADELAALRRKTFGFVFQRYNLLKTATAQENVEIPGIYDGMSKAERMERSESLLARLGMGNRLDHRPGELSGGQQQRVAVARALMNNPPVILADEPTGALDSQSGHEVMELLKSLHAEGRTIILITHDEKVAQNAHRIIRIHDGRISDDSGTVDGASGAVIAAERQGRTPSLPAEILQSFKTAFRALRTNIFRTALTLLGIIIGVAAVVTMMAIGDGSKQKVLNQINSMGTNVILVQPGMSGFRGGGDIITLTPDDAKAIEELRNVAAVMPERRGRQTLRFGNLDYATSVSGVSPAMPSVRNWEVESGNFFTDRDMQGNASVAVIGQTVVEKIFPNEENPIGKYMLIKNIPFEVIGIMARKGSMPWGGDQDDAVFVPLNTGLVRLFGRAYVNNISVKVSDMDAMGETETAIKQLLIARHRTEDFNVLNSASFIDMATTAQNTLTILLGAVAAISLLVGGIGVMNIMLVSVTERTREIGIRMATGARMRDIMLQFNIEAAVVCIIGGLLGLALGFGAGWAVSLFNVDVNFAPLPPILAFTSAVLTGLIFGYLPARKAARLDPVAALSTE